MMSPKSSKISIFLKNNVAKIQMYSESSVICGGVFVDQIPFKKSHERIRGALVARSPHHPVLLYFQSAAWKIQKS